MKRQLFIILGVVLAMCSAQAQEITACGVKHATVKMLHWDASWQYADYAVMTNDSVKLYTSGAACRKGKVVCVNAGHGSPRAKTYKVLCHPDSTPKCVSGSTMAGSIHAIAVSSGMAFPGDVGEGFITLKVAEKLRDLLLNDGYDVLMTRENNDCFLDNIARTVFANNNADIHIAIHFDGSTNDKGAFYVGVPNIKSYRKMEPVATMWREHERLGKAVNAGMKAAKVKIWKKGNMPTDLTQTSFSTIPSIDYECGDKGSDISDASLARLAQGFLNGINRYFSK